MPTGQACAPQGTCLPSRGPHHAGNAIYTDCLVGGLILRYRLIVHAYLSRPFAQNRITFHVSETLLVFYCTFNMLGHDHIVYLCNIPQQDMFHITIIQHDDVQLALCLCVCISCHALT